MESEFQDIDLSQEISHTYENIAKQVGLALANQALDTSSVNIFHHLLSESTIVKISEWTTEKLVKLGHAPTNIDEYKRFLGTRWLRSRFKMGNEKAFEIMGDIGKRKGFILLDLDRFVTLLHCTSGFSVNGRTGDLFEENETWLQRGVLLKEFCPLEKIVFERSIKTLLNCSNGSLVIDDELISSRAKDVESKTVSNRKAGKEGPVSDCLACSLTSVLYGMRLRVKGVTQEENVAALLSNLPHLTSSHDKVRLTFDRGYGKMPFVETNAKKITGSTVANTIGSRHPFIPVEESTKFINQCQSKGESQSQIAAKIALYRDWIVDEYDMMGSEIRIATKKVDKKTEVTAYSVIDIFDRKVESKVIRFFHQVWKTIIFNTL